MFLLKFENMRAVILLFIITTLYSASVTAQGNKPVKPVAGKPVFPKLRSFYGSMISGKINKEIAIAMIDQPLIVKDEKGTSFTIQRFSFSWTTTDYFENPETGERNKHTNNITSQAKGNKLEETFRQTIREELKPGDEFIIEKVLVKGPDGNSYLAPSMKFVIQ